jgi:branched-chain amino acid transport system ATP-binding protein
LSALLSIEGASVAYDKAEAVRNVSLAVQPGQIVTVIGPNGAGKTTLFDGVDFSGLEVEERVERGLCLVPEKRELFAELTVSDNLRLGAYLRRDRGIAADLADVLARFPRLHERRRQTAGTLSGGERQMLALGRALMMRPRLLMLDEPSLGLAPLIVREIFKAIASLREIGVSILLVEQNARAALQTADYGYILETGEIAGEGRAAELLADPALIATYLGSR